MKIATKEDAIKAIEAFEKIQCKYSKFGASDPEPNAFLSFLLSRAVHRGMDIEEAFKSVHRQNNPWELFETVSGWKRVSETLTRHVRKLIEKLLNAPYQSVKEALKYYGYDY